MPAGVRLPAVGDLRERVRLESLTSTVDTHGGAVSTWATIDTVWAAVWPVTGREAVQAARMTAVTGTVVWLRYRSDLSLKGRVVHGTRTLQIEDVADPDGHRHWTRLMCSEVSA